MSKFPTDLDDDTDLPAVNDNLNEIGGEAINGLREATFNIEQNIGLSAAGTTGSISARLDISLFPNGDIKPSAIASLGLVTLPITDGQISPIAQITESKLKLDHRTQDLFNYIQDLSRDTGTALGWISSTGIKLDPHLLGAIYRHTLEQIDVDANPARFLKNKFNVLRNNTDSYLLINDINSELLTHQLADGSPFTTPQPVATFDGSTYPSNYGHTASGIFINTSRLSVIPQTAQDLQQFVEFIDSASIFLYGTRIQNLYSNGISKVSSSASLVTDGYGAPVVPSTPAIAYLLDVGTSSSPFDSIDTGDDIIEFVPATADVTSNSFDAKFALVKVGDIVRVNYGTVELSFVIKEKKYIQDSGNKKYIVRIAGKNIKYAPNAIARIDKPLSNSNKYGVLSIAAANSSALPPSLILGHPRGAQALGVGFNPDQLDNSHYLLYLALYPTGNPLDGYTILPAIDVTGNRGTTVGQYTLDSVVAATNNAFRQSGFNYRFIAFQFEGEFGVMLADSYNNVSFSILNAVVASDGTYDELATNISFQNNVVGVFSNGPTAPDPLGFGLSGSNLATPPFMTSYGSAEASQNPTKIFPPLKRNNYYVNGIEKENLNLELNQSLDGYGDGYWTATILSKNIFPGPPPTGRVQTTYRIALDLSASSLKVGKTLVVQSLGTGNLVNFGRFTIESITFGCGAIVFTDITVYDAVHATALSPAPTADVGTTVALYFNSDSISFNNESATDFSVVSPFKRYFEVYVDQNGQTFTHERGRVNASGSTMVINGSVNLFTYSELQKLDIIEVSPKLRGYQFGSVFKVTLNMIDFNSTTGLYSGYLSFYDGSVFTHKGPLTLGKIGEVTRFYDETNIDYIDINFDSNLTLSSFSNQVIDFQLFPTLSLDSDIMLIASCQLNDVTHVVSDITDKRQFGNTSEKDLSTSALDFLSLPERALHSNGVIRGFDLVDTVTNPLDGYAGTGGQIYLTGGLVVVDGKFIQLNNDTVTIPLIKEFHGIFYNINWIICVNSGGEYQPIPLLDFDPILNTPTDAARIFKAFNLVTGGFYNIDATTFSDLINNRKDLTPLYLVASTTTPGIGNTAPFISLSVADARKYVNDADSILPLKLTSSNAQGNFKSVTSILNWLKYNNTFNSTVFLRGATGISGTVNSSITLDFIANTIIDGENDATLTINGPAILGSNLTIKNLNIAFNNSITMTNNVKNLTFDNCNITITVPNTPPALNIVFDIVNADNIRFINCNITIQYSVVFDSSSTSRGAAFRLTNSSDFVIDDTIISVSYITNPGVAAPGDIFKLNTCSQVKITGSQISGNFNKLLDFTSSNFISVIDSTVTSSYNPNVDGAPAADSINGVLFDPTNLVNSGSGYIYSNLSGVTNNIFIENTTFNYTPVAPNASAIYRYSFINLEFSTGDTILNNLNITNCKFNYTLTNAFADDLRPAISIINKSPTAQSFNQRPILRNAKIDNNICNKNQSIIITSVALNTIPSMVFPGLVSETSVISNNTCGMIGYWISASNKIINLSPSINTLSDKDSSLNIWNNTCHYISNVDHTGKYFTLTKLSGGITTNISLYPSGYVQIASNKANWIHVGIAYDENASLQIVGNNLSAYDSTYLNSYGDNSANAIFQSNQYAIFVSSNKRVFTITQSPAESNIGQCIISGNTTSTGYWTTAGLSSVKYTYAGYIFSQSTAQITKNILKGVGDTTGALVLLGGANSMVTHNQVYRGTSIVQSYIGFGNFDTPAYNGGFSDGMIVDNYLDGYTIDGTNTQVINIKSVPPSSTPNARIWTIERNKNQTATISIPVTNMISSFNFDGTYFEDPSTAFTVTTANNASSPSLFNSSVLKVVDSGIVALTTRTIGWQVNIEKYLPVGCRILSAQMSMKPFTSLVTTSNPPSIFRLTLTQHVNDADYLNLDVFTTVNDPDPNITGVIARTLTAAAVNGSGGSTLLMDIDLEHIDPSTFLPGNSDISGLFVVGNAQSNTVSLTINFKTAALSAFLFSPLIVTYRW